MCSFMIYAACQTVRYLSAFAKLVRNVACIEVKSFVWKIGRKKSIQKALLIWEEILQ